MNGWDPKTCFFGAWKKKTMANCEHNGEEFSIKEVVQVEKKLIGKGYFE